MRILECDRCGKQHEHTEGKITNVMLSDSRYIMSPDMEPRECIDLCKRCLKEVFKKHGRDK